MGAFSAVVAGAGSLVEGSNVTRNYRYFLRRIAEMPITGDQLFDAVKRLKVIDVKLDEHDDAQRVFESLNSTGLDLTEADKTPELYPHGSSPRRNRRVATRSIGFQLRGTRWGR